MQNLTIGYYPIRGKAQLCRLICEYLHIPYIDMFFTAKTWEEFQGAQNLIKYLYFQSLSKFSKHYQKFHKLVTINHQKDQSKKYVPLNSNNELSIF